jgi:hypothetical protein
MQNPRLLGGKFIEGSWDEECDGNCSISIRAREVSAKKGKKGDGRPASRPPSTIRGSMLKIRKDL